MSPELFRLDSAEDLPDAWDALCLSIFQRRPFLAHCEHHNPCRQHYYLLYRRGDLAAGAVVYSLSIDLFSFMGIPSPVRMQVVGVPCSVSSAGLMGEADAREALLDHIGWNERGLILALNLPPHAAAGGFARGRTWPTYVLNNRWTRWEDYAASLRSAYRRRLTRTERWMEGLDVATRPCSAYTEPMHRLYESVHARSNARLEKLRDDFFRNLQEPFRLTTFSRAGRLMGWVITVLDRGTFSFFLGGQSQDSDSCALYLAKLATVVRMGIEAGAERIELGQTAGIPKARMGSEPVELAMFGRHTSGLLNPLLRRLAPWLSYRDRFPRARVFREEPG